MAADTRRTTDTFSPEGSWPGEYRGLGYEMRVVEVTCDLLTASGSPGKRTIDEIAVLDMR
jgi:hypothetical protein